MTNLISIWHVKGYEQWAQSCPRFKANRKSIVDAASKYATECESDKEAKK